MATNLFGRYVWLVDTIRKHKSLTYKEINSLWGKGGQCEVKGEELPLRTFHNHRKAIADIFGLYIECDIKNGNRYYIENDSMLQNDALRNWLIDSYATMNQLQADRKLEGRIIFENVPSGNTWLTTITDAMRRSHVLKITHEGFCSNYASAFEIEPYYLKLYKQRWYVIARNPYFAEKKEKMESEGKNFKSSLFRVYALDRIQYIEDTNKTFEMDELFCIDKFFDGCIGVLPESKVKKEDLVIRAYAEATSYLRSLPLHYSQTEVATTPEYSDFSFQLKPTYDFILTVLGWGEQIQVIEPKSLRKNIMESLERLIYKYKKNE